MVSLNKASRSLIWTLTKHKLYTIYRKHYCLLTGASRRLGISTEEVIIILPRHDFSYFKNVLESGNAGLSKFYIHIDDDSFKLSGITISRNKGENEWVG